MVANGLRYESASNRQSIEGWQTGKREILYTKLNPPQKFIIHVHVHTHVYTLYVHVHVHVYGTCTVLHYTIEL